jgi:multiple sugar transport system permease protein
MSPVIFYNLVVGIISTFQLFTQVYVLTKGGPGNSTEVYNIYLYTTAFQYQKMGYASAQAWILLLLILGLTALVFKSSSAWVYYESEVKP